MGSYEKMMPVRGSAFENLAAFFHQDFGLLFPSFDAGLKDYIAGLKVDERTALREELRDILSNAETEADTRQAWVRAGAQWMAKGVKLHTTHQARPATACG